MTSTKVHPEFDAPPINEVVFGIGTNTEGFDLIDYGSLYSVFKDEYPRHSSQSPIASPGVREVALMSDVWPRSWFESDDQRFLIQLQAERIHFNWRKRFDPEKRYPGYEFLGESFFKILDKYALWRKETGKPELQPKWSELTYINYIEPSDIWATAKDAQKVFKTIDVGFSEDEEFTQFVVQNHLNLPKINSMLSFTLKNGFLKGEVEKPLFIVEIKVTNDRVDSDLHTWFSEAHDAVVNTFLRITTEAAQASWGKR